MNEQFITYAEYRALRKTALQRFLGAVAVMFVVMVMLVTIVMIWEAIYAI